MPDGHLFRDDPPDDLTRCRQHHAHPPAQWDVDCVLRILCKHAPDVVAHLGKGDMTIERRPVNYWEDPEFDGTKWNIVKVPFAGETSNDHKHVIFNPNQSCGDAAVTIYHETWHSKQKGLSYPADEFDAYYNTEKWTMKHKLPSQGWGFRKWEPTGHGHHNLVPNKKAIASSLGGSYGSVAEATPTEDLAELPVGQIPVQPSAEDYKKSPQAMTLVCYDTPSGSLAPQDQAKLAKYGANHAPVSSGGGLRGIPDGVYRDSSGAVERYCYWRPSEPDDHIQMGLGGAAGTIFPASDWKCPP